MWFAKQMEGARKGVCHKRVLHIAKLYEELYAHPFTNGDYLAIFLKLVNAIERMCCELGTICE